MNEDVEVFDLTRLPAWERLLESIYRDLYLPSFPNVDERESPADWIPRLEVNQPLPPQPLTYIFVAGRDLTIPDESRRSVHGLLIAEFYQQSMSALLTYLVVADSYRRHGLARALMDRAVGQLKVKATEFDGPLRAIFAEVHNPIVAEKNGQLDPYTRLDVMAKLGGRRVPITYVQPALGHDQTRVRSLLLFTFPLDNQSVTTIRTQVIKEFLGEFYCAEGVTDPDRDADFVRMIGGETREQIPLLISLSEVPVFSFATYGVAFHFLCPDVDASAPSSSPGFQSFERDLLTFSYRERPPFYSEVLSEVLKPWPSDLAQLQVVFPEILKYTAEGEEKELLTNGSRECSVRLYASRSVFPTRVLNGVRKGVAVLHLVLRPDSPSDEKKHTSATEWDLLKLIKLWEGGEGVGAPDAGSIQNLLRFVPTRTHESLTLVELARRVFRLDQGVDLLSRMGTVQIVTGPSDERVNWESLFDSAQALKDGSPIAADPKLPKQVKAIAGLLQGVLDFPFVDTAELQDVFKLVRIEETSLIGVHKGTILLISEEDRAFSAARTTIGISPYLLIPHAVLAYNDYLLGEAYKTDRSVENIRLTLAGRLQEAISKRSLEPLHRLLNRLQAAERAMEETLQKQFLPDVFHYPREKFLYEIGMASRGARDLKQSLERKLPPIHGKWADYREHKKRRHDVILTILLVGIGFLQLIAVIDVLDKWGVVPIAKWLQTWGWLAGTP